MWLRSLFTICAILVDVCESVIVKTAYGPVRGKQKYVSGNRVYEFLGIPYANPPIGDLRFKNPIKPSSWTRILEAIERPNGCIQPIPSASERRTSGSGVWSLNTQTSEDCLYLNVWTPNLVSNTTGRSQRDIHRSGDAQQTVPNGKPVMIWIHGGSLIQGSSTLEVYDGTYLASFMNVVIVSIQYRLGPFGFLYLGTEDAPGNQGLMDQVAALEWVHENIALFGGSKQQITLFGHSGGVVSVALHLLSPRSSGLFQQAILQSGSPLAWWATEGADVAREKAFQLGALSGCRFGRAKFDSTKLAKCLRSVDAGILDVNQVRMMVARNDNNSTRVAQLRRMFSNRLYDNVINRAINLFDIPFKPVAKSAFLPQWPYAILSSGNLQGRHRILLGVNKDEVCLTPEVFDPRNNAYIHFLTGSYGFGDSSGTGQTSLNSDPFDLLAYHIMDENFLHPTLLQATMFEYEIPNKYFGREKPDIRGHLHLLSQVAGDYNVKCPVVEFADFYSRLPNSQVFLYSFEHQNSWVDWPKCSGKILGNEVEYIFGAPFNPEFIKKFHNFTDDERNLSKEMMRLWTNFVSTG